MIRQKNFEEYFKHNLKLYIFSKQHVLKNATENAFVINDLMNSILIEVEKNLSANRLNATKQQTNLQNKNDTVVSNDEVPIPTS